MEGVRTARGRGSDRSRRGGRFATGFHSPFAPPSHTHTSLLVPRLPRPSQKKGENRGMEWGRHARSADRLGILRSDYMLHREKKDDDDDAAPVEGGGGERTTVVGTR